MTEEQIALAKRAVACKGWRWMPGMLIHAAGTAYRVPDRDHDPGAEDWWRKYTHPDLTDPATLGCLLALVREAHSVPFLQVSVKISRQHGYQFDGHPHHRGQWVDSEAEALVSALEDAP